MLKKYAIMSGVYSDWNIVGYISNLEDAYKYCAWRNSVDKYDQYYPVEMPCLDENCEIDIEFKYKYRTVFDLRKGSWAMRDINIDDVEPTNLDNYCNIRDGRKQYNISWIAIEFTMSVLDLDRAKKVAEDKLYQYLAEEQGL